MNTSLKKSDATFDLSSSGPFLPNDTSTCLIQVREFFAPHSIHNINEYSNSFVIQLHLADRSLYRSIPISIASGGYDIQTLMAALNKELKTQMQQYYTAGNITFSAVSLSFNSATGKVSWEPTLVQTNLAAKTNPITSLIALPYPSLLLNRLGFDVTWIDSFLQGSVTGYGFETSFSVDSVSLVRASSSSKLVNLSYPSAIYVTMDNVHANNVYAGTAIDVLDVLPIAGEFVFGDFIHIVHSVPFRQEVPHAQLKGSLTVRLWDENKNELDWQGQDWTLVLGVEWGLDTHAAGLETSNITEVPRPLLFRVPGYDSMDHYKYHHGGKKI